MPSKQHFGMGGHLATMAELANRGYNVAIPEIDIGDDIFAVNDANGNMWRLQVKTSKATRRRNGVSGQFRIKKSAITTALVPDVHFVLALRLPDRYRFLIINRAVMANYLHQGVGTTSVVQGVPWVSFYVSLLTAGGASCSSTSFSQHLEDWSTWPII